MNDRIVRKILLRSSLITILSAVFIYELKNLSHKFFLKNKHVLVIGILSAPENFDKRLSIRKTWLQLLPEISGSYYFIIGNEICAVPPVDRVSPYSCTDLPYILPKNVTPSTEFTTMKIHSFQSKDHILDFIGFGFYVRKDIVVKKIGILKEYIEAANREIQVLLVSAIDNSALASVTFGPEMLDDSNSKFLTKTIKTLSLKESDEAYIKIETKNLNRKFYPSCSFTTWQIEPNILYFTHLWEEDSMVPQSFTEKSCCFIFLTYNILDRENIREHIKNRTMRQEEWKKYINKLSVKLNIENQTYQDLLFVDVIDVYRNLSKKMIQFYKKVAEAEYFLYILKADDDSFIDLLRVYNELQLISEKSHEQRAEVVNETDTGIAANHNLSKFWMWSYFKEYWKVQRAGKWREYNYQSALYPSFPCGGGYVINKGIADYIVANEQNLQNFQGEDVSLGIWLSPLPIIQYKKPKKLPTDSYSVQKFITRKFGKKNSWNDKSEMNNLRPDLCEWTCNNKRKYNLPLCNKVQMTVEDMYKTWAKFIISGFL